MALLAHHSNGFTNMRRKYRASLTNILFTNSQFDLASDHDDNAIDEDGDENANADDDVGTQMLKRS